MFHITYHVPVCAGCDITHVIRMPIGAIDYIFHVTTCSRLMGVSKNWTDGLREAMEAIGHELIYGPDPPPTRLGFLYEQRRQDWGLHAWNSQHWWAAKAEIDNRWENFLAKHPCLGCGRIPESGEEWREWVREEIDVHGMEFYRDKVFYLKRGDVACSKKCCKEILDRQIETHKAILRERQCLKASKAALAAIKKSMRTGNLDALDSHRQELQRQLSSQDS